MYRDKIFHRDKSFQIPKTKNGMMKNMFRVILWLLCKELLLVTEKNYFEKTFRLLDSSFFQKFFGHRTLWNRWTKNQLFSSKKMLR